MPLAAMHPLPFSHTPAGRWTAIALGALMLCLVAAWNAGPLLYPDTPTYLRGAEMGAVRVLGPGARTDWGQEQASTAGQAPQEMPRVPASPAARLTSLDDRVVLAGRSVYYGAVLWFSAWLGSLWGVVLLQAVAAAWLLHLVMVDLGRASHPAYWAGTAMLSLMSPLSAFTGLLMPDVWAGLSVLALSAWVVYERTVARTQRAALAAIVLFALVSHASVVPLVGGLGLLAWAARRRAGWESLSRRALAGAVLCILAALVAEAVFTQAVTRMVGAAPLRLPHLSARLVDAGPGTAYLRRHCPQAGWAACDYVEHFPTPWTDFLFSTDPRRGAFALADAAGKRRLSNEQAALAWAILREDPAGVTRALVLDAGRQLASFRVDVWGLGPRELAMYEGRVPPREQARLAMSRAYRQPQWNGILTAATWAGVAAAGLYALLTGHRRRRDAGRSLPHRLTQLIALSLAGVVLNALVCGLLASPLDRFQARVMWLLPFAAWLAATARHSPLRVAQRARQAHSPGPAQVPPPHPEPQGARP